VRNFVKGEKETRRRTEKEKRRIRPSREEKEKFYVIEL
jgi:hypothetical protein